MRDDGISEGSKTVHPSGNPISHSTHVGFNEPPVARATLEGRSSSPTDRRPAGCDGPFQSVAPGVGQNRTTSFKGREFVGKVSSETGAPFQSLLLGVGHRFRCAAHFCIEGAIMFAFAVGVGNNPDPVPAVRCANG